MLHEIHSGTHYGPSDSNTFEYDAVVELEIWSKTTTSAPIQYLLVIIPVLSNGIIWIDAESDIFRKHYFIGKIVVAL